MNCGTVDLRYMDPTTYMMASTISTRLSISTNFSTRATKPTKSNSRLIQLYLEKHGTPWKNMETPTGLDPCQSTESVSEIWRDVAIVVPGGHRNPPLRPLGLSDGRETCWIQWRYTAVNIAAALSCSCIAQRCGHGRDMLCFYEAIWEVYSCAVWHAPTSYVVGKFSFKIHYSSWSVKIYGM